jgi:signal transduction histidine kinase
MVIDVAGVLQFSHALQGAATLGELVAATEAAVRRSTGYGSAWIAAIEEGPPRMARILAVAGGLGSELAQEAVLHPVDGDPMLEEVFAADHPVVVIDARTDPRTNKAMVELLGNRTLINVPILLGERRLGALGLGSFGAEGVRPPTADQLETLVVFATQLAAAFLRVKVQVEQQRIQQRLIATQRLQSVALLAGGVAHDFNNLISAILSGAQLLSEGPLEAEQRACLADIEEAAQRSKALVRKLLALGRKQELALSPTDLGGLFAGLERLLLRLLPAGIALELHAPAGLPPALADGPQLEQVLLNLVVNARDAMPEGGTIAIRAQLRPGPLAEHAARLPALSGGCLAISVADDGQGMAPEVQAHILEPFFTTKPDGRGTGLGLAVAAAILEQHGGLLTCTSALGVGTTFELLLPIAPPVQASAPSRAS